MDADDKRLLEDDRKFFFTADQDEDGKLSNTEFHAFQNPESFPHMHAALIEVILWAYEIFLEHFTSRMMLGKGHVIRTCAPPNDYVTNSRKQGFKK